jgi:hypothetical protein
MPQLKVPKGQGVTVSNQGSGYPPKMAYNSKLDGKLLYAATAKPGMTPPKNIDLSPLKLKKTKAKRKILRKGWTEEQ